jgi:DNA-binding transcriptional LysR family regulator
VRWQRLFAQRLYLVVPHDHRFAGSRSVALADAANEEFVMLRPTWELRALSDELCAEAGFAPKVAFEVDDLPVVHGFVAAGLGVGIVPADEDEPQHAGPAAVMVRLRDPRATRDVGVAWSRERRLLPSAELFRKHVLATSGRH